jgi:hypothetical protein
MELTTEIITPEIAKKYLSEQNTNRKPNSKYISELATEMLNGRWIENSEAIKFDENNRLIDGQHRLYAIIRSKLEFSFNVIRGYTADTMTVIDIGKSRSAAHICQIKGMDVTNTHISCIQAMGLPDVTQFSLNKTKALELVQIHEKALRFVVEFKLRSTSNTKVNRMPAILLGLLTKAYYYEDHEAIADFMEIYQSNFARTEEDYAAIAIANYVNKGKLEGTYYASYTGKINLYLRSQLALRNFIIRNSIKHVGKPSKSIDYYPIPGINKETPENLRIINKGFNNSLLTIS